eukprot:jgi/Tetstr1/461135/TSEL_006273.t1
MTLALDVIRERYLRPGTQNMGSPELLELYKDRVYDANNASAAKTTARQSFGGALRRNDATGTAAAAAAKTSRHFTRPGRAAVAPRATFAKDATKDYGKGKAKNEAPTVDMSE